jgi:tight adherence protein B
MSSEVAGSERLTAVVEEALWLAARSGLPPTILIRRSAAEERRRQTAAQMRAVRRLEVLLVVPAGLCLLPAFILLGVVPVILDLVLG